MHSEASPAARLYRDALELHRQKPAGPDWLGDLRAEALATAIERGLPGRHHENWRYTNLDEFGERSADYLRRSAEEAAEREPARITADGGIPGWEHPGLTLVDGLLPSGLPEELTRAAASSGLHVSTLRGADDTIREQARALLATTTPAPDTDSLVALNTALFDDALLIRTTADRGATPLLLTLLATGRPVPLQPRILIDLAAGSSFTLVLRHTGDGPALVNAVTQIRCGRGASLRLIRLQEASPKTLLVETIRIGLEADAQADVTTLDLGARLSRLDLDISLAGPGASSEVHGLFLADGDRHVDNHTRADHLVPRTSSREIFRGIMDDSGHGVFNGRIVVHPGAVKTDAALTNRNLLLTRSAEIDTKPELEIYADDVRCSHGATTGQLDPAALFYLRSRGIDPEEGRRLLITAFAREVMESVEETTLRAYVDAVLEQRLVGAVLPDSRPAPSPAGRQAGS